MSTSRTASIRSEAGQGLGAIVAHKEAERVAGNGVFWCGIGNSLGDAVRDAAQSTDSRTLRVLFSKMLSTPQAHDVNPSDRHVWTRWGDRDGRIYPVPPHVRVVNRVSVNRDYHYALVCFSRNPLSLGECGPFDPSLCQTRRGKKTVHPEKPGNPFAYSTEEDTRCSFGCPLFARVFRRYYEPGAR